MIFRKVSVKSFYNRALIYLYISALFYSVSILPQVTDIQEKYRRVDVERDTYIRKCREITESYEQKIRVLQQQISELRTQPTRPVQPIQQPLPVLQPTIVSYTTAPCYVDTMTELGISIEKYNEMKRQRDSIEQR